MLASAMNFAIGFFGYPFEGQYQQSITIEEAGVRPFLLRLLSQLTLIKQQSLIIRSRRTRRT
jgi:hypothetical protein